MTRKRTRTMSLAVFGAALLGCLVLVCCQKPTTQVQPTPAPEAQKETPPPTTVQTPPAPEPTPTPNEEPEPQPASQPPPGPIKMDQPDKPKEPPLPPFMAVVEEIDPANRSRVTATVEPPRKLVVDTDNVKRMRLTRERLPLARNRSIVLQVDGQGIEWSAKHVAIELERSPAGDWTVVRRRSRNP